MYSFERRSRKAFMKTGSKVERIKQLKKSKTPYYIEYNSQGTTITIETLFSKEMYSNLKLKQNELNFIQKVKKEVLSSNLSFVKKDWQPFFFKRKQKEEGRYLKMIEIDINAAYWETLKRSGTISEATYLQGISDDISKQGRLAAIGSLGKKTTTLYFDGERVYPVETKEAPTRDFWFYIVQETDEAINNVFIETDALFFWVDAIFLEQEKEEKAIQLFEQAGYKVKTKRLEYIDVFNNRIEAKAEGKDKVKVYTFPHHDKSFLNYFRKDFE